MTTLPSQFSLEEENFYKDIQDLVKKGSQNEKELSLFLERYMDLLARADLDDETFIINFTKAGLIIEASAKVYGTKVDKLWMNLEHVLESLKSKSQGHVNKKKPDGEEDVGDDIDMEGICEEGRKKLPNLGRRRKKIGDVLFSSDEFIEIDNFTGLLGKNMNETNNVVEGKIKLCEKVPNMFIKNKSKKKKVDVCLNKSLDDKDIIRLRDWIISESCLLVKEIYTPHPENIISMANSLDEEEFRNTYCNSEPCRNEDNLTCSNVTVAFVAAEVVPETESIKEEKNNNTQIRLLRKPDNPETTVNVEPVHDENFNSSSGRILGELHISKELDVAKFPNVISRPSTGRLMDVDEVFWNSSKFHDVIPSKKRRSGKTVKAPCQLCATEKIHKKKSAKCVQGKKIKCLDSYFTPHVQPTIAEPNFGIVPDEELYSVFKLEMKLIEQLEKVDTCKNINEAYHPDESPEEIRNFLGFDGFENYLMKRIPELQEDEISEEMLDHLEDDNDNYVEERVPNQEFDLPFPVTENNFPANCIFEVNDPELQTNEVLTHSESEYQKLVIEELKDHYAAKDSFARNKELGIKISKWHEMIADKIKLSQERGALNMNLLAEKIMNAFPDNLDDERPSLTFNELVREQSRRDIPRYFFACLQLTNEGNLDIGKLSSEPLATDCMIVTRLRTARTNFESEECSGRSPSKQLNSAKSIVVPIKRKITSLSNSSFILDDNVNQKKKFKQKTLTTYKRSKNFNSVNNSKRRKCSVSSSDSVTLE